MKCSKCGKIIDDDSRFCRFCGNPVETVEETVQKEEIKEEKKTGMVLDLEELEEEEDEDEGFIGVFLKNINPLHLVAFAVLLCLLVSVTVFAVLKKDNKNLDEDVLGDSENPTAELIVWDDAESTTVEDEEETVSDEEAQDTVDEAFYDPDFTDDKGIHEYELIIDDLSWTEAYQECINKGGYLVRLNSDEETEYVLKQISKEGYDNVYFYIGASRNEDSKDYYWVNSDAKHFGEALNKSLDYESYWLYGEPSYKDTDLGTEECFLDMLNHPDEGKWYFNDISDDGLYSFMKGKKRIGYICEYENK
ncbi:MAG: zinc-ribbon domain-containing protein [Lachnospiraceae bacterium]|nr:zinc-ribbon domain-containing protein [Lachnospiraceae bacterium]